MIYEYVFPFGLGITGGITIPLMGFFAGDGADASIGAGAGIGLSDLGVSYHLKNGLTFYTRGNVGYAGFFGGNTDTSATSTAGEIGGSGGVMWGAGAGLGYWF